MRSKKLSIILGFAIIAIDIFLFVIYFQKQGKYTFEFVKNLLNYLVK